MQFRQRRARFSLEVASAGVSSPLKTSDNTKIGRIDCEKETEKI
jgi:hypothetical protein